MADRTVDAGKLPFILPTICPAYLLRIQPEDAVAELQGLSTFAQDAILTCRRHAKPQPDSRGAPRLRPAFP